MKRVMFSVLSATLAFSFCAPSVMNAKANPKSTVETNTASVEPYDGADIKIILNTDNLIIYQKEENGIQYEYHEKSVVLGKTTEVTISKYQIRKNQKIKVDEIKQSIIEESEDTFTVSDNQSRKKVVININEESKTVKNNIVTNQTTNLVADSYSYAASGGSYIADVRYTTYSNGKATAIMAGQSPYSKNTTTSNGNFKVFKVYADDLRKQELELTVIGGAIAIADAVIDAVRSGKILSMTLIKTIAKKVGKSIPVIGTLYGIYNYVDTWIDARGAYRKI